MAKITDTMKNLVMGKDTGKISWTKIWMWVATTSLSIAQFNQQITEAGIAIPPEFVPVFKVAGIIAGIITVIKLRDRQAA